MRNRLSYMKLLLFPVVAGIMLSFMARRRLTSASNERRLLLYFDINKTILVEDPAGGKSTEAMLNSILAECVWGRVEGSGPESIWTLVSSTPSTDPPGGDEALVTYGYFLEFVKYVGTENRKQRGSLKIKFTEPGQPGQAFAKHFQQLAAALALPAACAESSKDFPFLAAGRHFLLPSFFHTLLALHREGRAVSVVFRTFGTDGLVAAKEMALFCRGAHPCFPGVALPSLCPVLPEKQGIFFRAGPGDGHTALAMGTLEEPPKGCTWSEALDFYGSQAEVQVTSGFMPIYAKLQELLWGNHRQGGGAGAGSTLVLRDNFRWWHQNEESADSGKLMLVDPSDKTVLPIFFDDNIERHDPHIVDVRVLPSGVAMAFDKSRGRYIVKAEPLHAILDHEYFLKAIKACEAATGQDKL